MERNITESPEMWLVLDLKNGSYKVWGGWRGGYLDGDRYKVNSGITRVESDDDYYYIYGVSGSCYKCKKGTYYARGSWLTWVMSKIIDAGVSMVMESDLDELFDKINNGHSVANIS